MAPLQFCTTSSRRYLPYPRALGESIRRSNPESTLWVLLTDDHRHHVDKASEVFRGVWNEELDIEPEELHRRFLIHAPDFHIAIKPWIVEHVLNQTGGPVMFIDSDVRVYGRLDDIGRRIDEHGTLLTPHMRAPLPQDGLSPDDTIILGAGIYNAGMVGVGERGRDFLEFWKSRLRRECYVDIAKMRVGEQRWLDFVPSITECHILRDPGVNAAYWNLHERPLTIDGQTIFAGERPLRAFHFSGHDLGNPDLISRHMVDNARFQMATQPILAALCARYRSEVLAQGYEEAREITVDFAELPGGIPITSELREIYRLSVIAAEHAGIPCPPDPYDLSQRADFVAWAQRAYPAAGCAVPEWAASRPEEPAPMREISSIDFPLLLSKFAESSSTALTDLDQRLRWLETRLT